MIKTERYSSPICVCTLPSLLFSIHFAAGMPHAPLWQLSRPSAVGFSRIMYDGSYFWNCLIQLSNQRVYEPQALFFAHRVNFALRLAF